jgi:hypothetical protein
MGSRGQRSASAKSASNPDLDHALAVAESKGKYLYRSDDTKRDIEKQVKIAKKLDGTKLGADFHGGDESYSLFKIGSKTSWDNMFTFNLEDWAKGYNKPLGISKKDFKEVQSHIKKLHKKYDYTTIATAYNYAHLFKDYWDIGLKG